MNLSDFLKKQSGASGIERIGFEPEILEHFDATVMDVCAGAKVVVVTDMTYRDYVENRLLKSLSLHGVEASYCLCVKSVESYAAQITNAIGATSGAALIVSLGDESLLRAARVSGVKAGIAKAMAVLKDMPSRTLFNEVSAERGCSIVAMYFDLAQIRTMSPGDWREKTASLEIYADAFLIEAHLCEALGRPVTRGVKTAIGEIESLRGVTATSDETVSELCEGYAWLAAARAALGYDSSLDFVMAYDEACSQHVPTTVYDHAAMLAHLIDVFVEVESLEIDPDDCASHQLPAEIYKRSVNQILIGDEVDRRWLSCLDESYEARQFVRSRVHALVDAWDELCESLRIRGAMIHGVLDDLGIETNDESLRDAWSHAAKLANANSFVRTMDVLRLLEGALFE